MIWNLALLRGWLTVTNPVEEITLDRSLVYMKGYPINQNAMTATIQEDPCFALAFDIQTGRSRDAALSVSHMKGVSRYQGLSAQNPSKEVQGSISPGMKGDLSGIVI
jgi:hypothetical protein